MKANLGKVTAAWPRGETGVLLAGSSRVCGRTGPGARVRRWKPLPGLPAGPTLPPEAARSTAFLHFLLLLQPQTDGAWSQAVLRKARGGGVGLGARAQPRLEPRSRGQVQSPMSGSFGAPRRGTYPFQKAGRSLARSVLGRPSSPFSAARGVYAVSFATEPSGFPAARKSLCASATRLLRSYAP